MNIPARIVRLARLQNTKDGNPRFNVITEGGGAFTTEPDGAVGFTIQNYVGKNVVLTVDEANKVTHVAEA